MIVIVDYGMGNLRSILNKIQRQEIDIVISSNKDDIEKADKLILPGVGHYAAGMENLHQSGLSSLINRKVLIEKTPILGICLGMQLVSKWSEEGRVNGLGWVDCRTIKFPFLNNETGLKIPHMGWNTINIRKESPLLTGIQKDAQFYFVHSYHLELDKIPNETIASTTYGIEFPSIIQKDNIFGTQFHPEKSHQAGITILINFVKRV